MLKKILTNDIHHQITATLVKPKPKWIIIYDLNVIGVIKNKHFILSLLQSNFFMILKGILNIRGDGMGFVNRFYPSYNLVQVLAILIIIENYQLELIIAQNMV